MCVSALVAHQSTAIGKIVGAAVSEDTSSAGMLCAKLANLSGCLIVMTDTACVQNMLNLTLLHQRCLQVCSILGKHAEQQLQIHVDSLLIYSVVMITFIALMVLVFNALSVQSALERLLQGRDSPAACHPSADMQPALAMQAAPAMQPAPAVPAASAAIPAEAADAEHWNGQ